MGLIGSFATPAQRLRRGFLYQKTTLSDQRRGLSKKGKVQETQFPAGCGQSPQNLAPQRFSASTASTEGARCATFEQKYGFFDSLRRCQINVELLYSGCWCKARKRRVHLSFLPFFGRVGVDDVCSFHQVVQTGLVKLSQKQQIARRRNPYAPFVFGQQALVDACGNIHGNLSQSAGEPYASQVAHTHHP